jgi:hypothetical protein
VIMFWLAIAVWSGSAGYALGAWWSTRLTRAERRLAERYLYCPMVSTRTPEDLR